MATGRVKFWNKGGWGIVTPAGVKSGDREREVFVHSSKLEGIRELGEGQDVEFSLFPGSVPPRALVVRLLGKDLSYVRIDQGRREYGD